jgi:hypothetical protein
LAAAPAIVSPAPVSPPVIETPKAKGKPPKVPKGAVIAAAAKAKGRGAHPRH